MAKKIVILILLALLVIGITFTLYYFHLFDSPEFHAYDIQAQLFSQ